MAFDKTAADEAAKELKSADSAAGKETMLGYAKTGVTVLIILLVLAALFFITKKKASTFQSTPLSMAELDAAMPALPSAAEMLDSAPVDNSPESIERAKVDKEITGLIERQPEEVASLLRSWLADRRS